MVGVTCPDCGTIAVFDYQMTPDPEPRSCAKCGCDLTWSTVPRAKCCGRYQIDCGNPCAQANQDPIENTESETCPSRSVPIPHPDEA